MRLVRLSCAAALTLLATGLGAQTLPVPTLPPEPAPEPSPQANPSAPTDLPAADPSQRSRWEYAAGVGLLWDSNVGFNLPEGPSDAFFVPRLALARVFAGRHGELSIGAVGQYTGYVEQEAYNRSYGLVGIEGQHASSRRTKLHGSGSYSRGYSDLSRPLLEQGVLLPLVRTDTITGNLGLAQQLGSRTFLRFDGRIYRADFDDPTLFDGQSVRGTLQLENQVSSRNTLGLVYAPEYVFADRVGENDYLGHYGSLQWTRILTQRTGLLLEGGASYTPDASQAGLERQVSFFGGASLTRRLEQSDLTAFVRREVAPAFGTGVSRVETRVGLSAIFPLGLDWEVRAAGTYVRPDATDDAIDTFGDAVDSSITLIRRVGRRLEISANGSFRRRGATGDFPEINAGQAGLTLTLTNPR